ncbi:hypothetical protein STXM2123_3952 [Streptomyces sp. F-3]|nr:hypothetical protein STXM2123_3952 [Streptomyces sp. F-3]
MGTVGGLDGSAGFGIRLRGHTGEGKRVRRGTTSASCLRSQGFDDRLSLLRNRRHRAPRPCGARHYSRSGAQGRIGGYRGEAVRSCRGSHPTIRRGSVRTGCWRGSGPAAWGRCIWPGRTGGGPSR